MTIIITATNRLTNKVEEETCAQVNSIEEARSLHTTHRALFTDSDVDTFSQYGPLFNNVSVSAKSECKAVNVKKQSDAYFKWFGVNLN